MSQLSGVLLTTADRQIEGFTIGKDPMRSFEDSFYEAVIFHDRAVLPDIFAFISTALYKAQRSVGVFHLDKAIESGLVVPAFRGTCKSFNESLSRINEQGIQGTQSVKKFIANRLDENFSKSRGQNFIQWPESLSRDYANLVMRVMRAIVANPANGNVNAISEQQFLITAEFINQNEIIELIQMDINSKNGELLRGRFYNILLKILDEIKPSGVDIVDDCFQQLYLHPACNANPRVQAAIMHLLVVANTAYHLNMSSAFSAGNYTPGRLFKLNVLPVVDHTVSIAKGIDTLELSPESKPEKSLSVDIEIPSVNELRSLKWEELIAIRNDIGSSYFSALKDWHSDPKEFEHCLREYARALTSRVHIKASRVSMLLHKFSDSESAGIAAMAKFALQELATISNTSRFLGIAGVASSFLMSWNTDRSVNLSFKQSSDVALVI